MRNNNSRAHTDRQTAASTDTNCAMRQSTNNNETTDLFLSIQFLPPLSLSLSLSLRSSSSSIQLFLSISFTTLYIPLTQAYRVPRKNGNKKKYNIIDHEEH